MLISLCTQNKSFFTNKISITVIFVDFFGPFADTPAERNLSYKLAIS